MKMSKRILKSIALALVIAMVFSVAAFAAQAPAEKPFENSQFFTSGDYKIHYRVFQAQGEQKGRILFLH